MDTSNMTRLIGVTSGARYYRQDCPGRPDMSIRAHYNRKEKRVENINWRAELRGYDTQQFEAFEDRERILDHISDTHWYGVHDRSIRRFVLSLHNPATYGLAELGRLHTRKDAA